MTIPPTTPSPTIPALLSSSSFYLAAGTVTIDPSLRKVLIIHDRDDSSYKLPRGHKDWGESLEATALRETLEETGFHAALLPVPLASRASVPRDALRDTTHPYHAAAIAARFDAAGDMMVRGSARLTEPFALMQHYQPDGSLAVVLWFVAEGDSTAVAGKSMLGEGEDYEARWVDFDVAPGLMVNDLNARLIKQAVELADAAHGGRA